MEPSERPLLQQVAGNLRAARHARDWSQQTLADRAGVSRRMVVAIEAGESNVSLGTLDRLAAALEIPFVELLREQGSPGQPVPLPVLAWEGTRPGSRARLLASTPIQGSLELWEWSLAPGERYVAEPDRPGTRELLYVASGTLTLELGERRLRLGQGESAVYPSDQHYAHANEGEEPLRFVKTVVG
jgi:transcriptional regulator with XRE-family HTH domain